MSKAKSHQGESGDQKVSQITLGTQHAKQQHRRHRRSGYEQQDPAGWDPDLGSFLASYRRHEDESY